MESNTSVKETTLLSKDYLTSISTLLTNILTSPEEILSQISLFNKFISGANSFSTISDKYFYIESILANENFYPSISSCTSLSSHPEYKSFITAYDSQEKFDLTIFNILTKTNIPYKLNKQIKDCKYISRIKDSIIKFNTKNNNRVNSKTKKLNTWYGLRSFISLLSNKNEDNYNETLIEFFDELTKIENRKYYFDINRLFLLSLNFGFYKTYLDTINIDFIYSFNNYNKTLHPFLFFVSEAKNDFCTSIFKYIYKNKLLYDVYGKQTIERFMKKYKSLIFNYEEKKQNEFTNLIEEYIDLITIQKDVIKKTTYKIDMGIDIQKIQNDIIDHENKIVHKLNNLFKWKNKYYCNYKLFYYLTVLKMLCIIYEKFRLENKEDKIHLFNSIKMMDILENLIINSYEINHIKLINFYEELCRLYRPNEGDDDNDAPGLNSKIVSCENLLEHNDSKKNSSNNLLNDNLNKNKYKFNIKIIKFIALYVDNTSFDIDLIDNYSLSKVKKDLNINQKEIIDYLEYNILSNPAYIYDSIYSEGIQILVNFLIYNDNFNNYKLVKIFYSSVLMSLFNKKNKNKDDQTCFIISNFFELIINILKIDINSKDSHNFIDEDFENFFLILLEKLTLNNEDGIHDKILADIFCYFNVNSNKENNYRLKLIQFFSNYKKILFEQYVKSNDYGFKFNLGVLYLNLHYINKENLYNINKFIKVDYSYIPNIYNLVIIKLIFVSKKIRDLCINNIYKNKKYACQFFRVLYNKYLKDLSTNVLKKIKEIERVENNINLSINTDEVKEEKKEEEIKEENKEEEIKKENKEEEKKEDNKDQEIKEENKEENKEEEKKEDNKDQEIKEENIEEEKKEDNKDQEIKEENKEEEIKEDNKDQVKINESNKNKDLEKNKVEEDTSKVPTILDLQTYFPIKYYDQDEDIRIISNVESSIEFFQKSIDKNLITFIDCHKHNDIKVKVDHAYYKKLNSPMVVIKLSILEAKNFIYNLVLENGNIYDLYSLIVDNKENLISYFYNDKNDLWFNMKLKKYLLYFNDDDLIKHFNEECKVNVKEIQLRNENKKKEHHYFKFIYLVYSLSNINEENKFKNFKNCIIYDIQFKYDQLDTKYFDNFMNLLEITGFAHNNQVAMFILYIIKKPSNRIKFFNYLIDKCNNDIIKGKMIIKYYDQLINKVLISIDENIIDNNEKRIIKKIKALMK